MTAPIEIAVEAATTLAPEEVFARLADLPAATRSEPRLREADWDPGFAVGATARLRTDVGWVARLVPSPTCVVTITALDPPRTARFAAHARIATATIALDVEPTDTGALTRLAVVADLRGVAAAAPLSTAIARASRRYATPSLRRVLTSFLHHAAQERR